MKELSIEEKARRYDEAINVTTNLVKAGLICEDAAIHIFPQLNKIDDERIRKALISRFNESGELDGISYDNIRAWLEKQGTSNEQSIQNDDNIVTNEDGTYFNISQLERVAKKVTKTKENAEEFLKLAEIMDENGELAEEYRLKKQGEQKVWEHAEPVTEDDKLHLMMDEPNPSWSEEDENINQSINILIKQGFQTQVNWLKSLKDRMQPQSQSKEWGEENEIWIDRACMLLDELNHLSTLTLAKIPSNVNDIISHLKSLKHR